MIVGVLEAYAIGATITVAKPTYIQEVEVVSEPVAIEEVVVEEPVVEEVPEIVEEECEVQEQEVDYIPDEVEPEPESEPEEPQVEEEEYFIEIPMEVHQPDHVDGEVIALVESDERAQELAEQYGLTLKRYASCVAVYDTGDIDCVEFCNGLTDDDYYFELNYICELY